MIETRANQAGKARDSDDRFSVYGQHSAQEIGAQHEI
jgi:hypothetical protein